MVQPWSSTLNFQFKALIEVWQCIDTSTFAILPSPLTQATLVNNRSRWSFKSLSPLMSISHAIWCYGEAIYMPFKSRMCFFDERIREKTPWPLKWNGLWYGVVAPVRLWVFCGCCRRLFIMAWLRGDIWQMLHANLSVGDLFFCLAAAALGL